MPKINLLSSQVSNLIAAGEVLERPASAVKELVENSIDAGATRIIIEVEGSGKKLIKIIDNGSGMEREDAKMAPIRHATSKIKTESDLEAIGTLGFRGEALASISAVSRVEIVTKTDAEQAGTRLVIEGGEVKAIEDIGCNTGTVITVTDLFFNTPARLKFMKSDHTEMSYIEETVEKFIIANKNISFKLIRDKKEIMYSAGDNDTLSNITNIYKAETADNLTEINYSADGIKITGYIGNNRILRNNRKYQMLFVNGRAVRSKIFYAAADEALKERVVTSKYPFLVLLMELDPTRVDVNVHPTKAEVKFSDERFIYMNIYNAVQSAFKVEGAESFQRETEPSEAEEQSFYKPSVFETPAPRINIFEKIKEKKAPVNGFYELKTDTFEAVTPSSVSSVKVSYEKEKEPEKPYIKDYKIAGQLFDTYIIIEKEDKMYLLDQHAAHERLIYDRLIKTIGESEKYSQPLLAPLIYDISPTEHTTIRENLDIYEKLGFKIEDFSESSIAVRAVPNEIESGDIFDIITEICGNIAENKVSHSAEKCERAVYTMACKAAIKANKRLTPEEAEQLVYDVLVLQKANTCPHGRPLFISYSKYEIEKQFKRA